MLATGGWERAWEGVREDRGCLLVEAVPTAKTRWSQEPDWLCGSQLPQGAKKGALLAEKARVPTDCLVWGSWHTRSSGHAEPHKLPAWPLSQQSNPWYSQSTVFPKELSQDNLGSPHSCPPPLTA